MKTSWLVLVVIIIVLAGGGWYAFSMNSVTPASSVTPEVADSSNAAGLNGSPNQGNLGQSDTGVVQQPLADGAEGSIIGNNVALGTDSNTKLGTYLIGYNGMTVYTYSKDTGNTSTCYDACAKNWPPYLVGAEDNINQLKAGVTGKADTVIRTDGSIQVTYNGHPLYFYVGDKASSDATGDGVGGVWKIAKP